MKIYALCAMMLLTGCAGIGEWGSGVTPGLASYTLESKDCKATVVSGRDISKASIKTGEGCTLEAELEGVTGQEAQLKTLELLDRLLP